MREELELDRFEALLRDRLKQRWACEFPSGAEAGTVDSNVQFVNFALSPVYLRFLSICGSYAGNLFFDYSWKLTELSQINDKLHNYADYAGVELPSQKIFAFLSFIDDYFWCFIGDQFDPVVLIFDHCEFREFSPNLSEFFLNWDQFETPD